MTRKTLQALAPLDPLQRYSINETCEYLRLSRDRLYELIRAGEIRTIKDGKRTYVPGGVIVERSA